MGSAPITWYSKLKHYVAIPTAESEYYSLNDRNNLLNCIVNYLKFVILKDETYIVIIIYGVKQLLAINKQRMIQNSMNTPIRKVIRKVQ